MCVNVLKKWKVGINMDFAFNEEQQEIIKVVRDLVQKEIVPYAGEMDEQGKMLENITRRTDAMEKAFEALNKATE